MNSIPAYLSLLSREESTALKGLLIFLVVLGHNSLVMAKTGWFPYLYSFHVYCFYIFPFVYGADVVALKGTGLWQRVWDNVKKFYPLYFFWCLISCGVAVATHRLSFDVRGFVYAVLWGNQNLLLRYCGFGFLWFLPTIVAVMFWRDVYFVAPKIGKWCMFLLSAILWILSAVGWTNFHAAGIYCPLAVMQGLFFCTSGILVRTVLSSLPVSKGTKIAAIPFFILGVSFVYFRRYLPASCVWLTWIIVPTITFLVFYQWKDVWMKSRLLKFFGKYSLQIYLLHIFIFYGISRAIPQTGMFGAVLSFPLTLALCAGVIVVIAKMKFVRWMIFSIK